MGTIAIAFLAACSDPPPIPKTGNGELHQGTFVFGEADGLPDGIAVDADFELHYEPSAPQATTLEPAPDFFTVTNDTFHATRAGYGAVLVMNAGGNVIDFVNLHVKTVASLAIAGVDAPLAVGDTKTLTASAFDVVNAPLAGTLTFDWESSDPAIATVTVTDGVATLHAVAPGTVHIRAIAGSATSAIDVQVGS